MKYETVISIKLLLPHALISSVELSRMSGERKLLALLNEKSELICLSE